MTANHSKFYLSYLNKVVDQYNNTYHYSLNKNPINVNYSALPEKNETNSKPPKFKVKDRVIITMNDNIFGEGCNENWRREIFIIDFFLNSYFRGKINVVLDLSNYATKTELEHDTGINTSDLAAKRDFITLEA